MSDPSAIDMDTLVAVVAALLMVACLWGAVQGFRRGAIVAGIGALVGAVALAFIAYFFATFTLKLF